MAAAASHFTPTKLAASDQDETEIPAFLRKQAD